MCVCTKTRATNCTTMQLIRSHIPTRNVGALIGSISFPVFSSTVIIKDQEVVVVMGARMLAPQGMRDWFGKVAFPAVVS